MAEEPRRTPKLPCIEKPPDRCWRIEKVIHSRKAPPFRGKGTLRPPLNAKKASINIITRTPIHQSTSASECALKAQA
jgi:hypothetical protein